MGLRAPSLTPRSFPQLPAPILRLKRTKTTQKGRPTPADALLKKGKKSFLGYQGYSAVDAEDGYTEGVPVVPANESEVHKLEGVVDQITDVRGQAPHGALADKDYHSAANREMFKGGGIVDLIQHKASCDTPLQTWYKASTRW